MDIGKLRHLIEFESPVDVRDNMGGVTKSWSIEQKAWAQLTIAGETSELKANKEADTAEYDVLVRFNGAVTTEWRFNYRSKYYEILSVHDVNITNHELKIKARVLVA